MRRNWTSHWRSPSLMQCQCRLMSCGPFSSTHYIQSNMQQRKTLLDGLPWTHCNTHEFECWVNFLHSPKTLQQWQIPMLGSLSIWSTVDALRPHWVPKFSGPSRQSNEWPFYSVEERVALLHSQTRSDPSAQSNNKCPRSWTRGGPSTQSKNEWPSYAVRRGLSWPQKRFNVVDIDTRGSFTEPSWWRHHRGVSWRFDIRNWHRDASWADRGRPFRSNESAWRSCSWNRT